MVILASVSMTPSPSESPTMEAAVDQTQHPHHKASVNPNSTQPYFNPPSNDTDNSLTITNDVSASGVGGQELSDDAVVCDGFNINNDVDVCDSLNINLKKAEDNYFRSFPPGFRFNPSDEELIVHYLKKKVLGKPLPRNRIIEVNLYWHNPEVLAGTYERYGEQEKVWYFFTPRDRKYRNGSRPRRAAGDGYWKATGADKEIKSGNAIVGFRKALVFYRGKPPKGDKTNWIMHEFRVKEAPIRTRMGDNDMRLDDWVLCRIYKKADKNSKRGETQNSMNGHFDDGLVIGEVSSSQPQPCPSQPPPIVNDNESIKVYESKYGGKGQLYGKSSSNEMENANMENMGFGNVLRPKMLYDQKPNVYGVVPQQPYNNQNTNANVGEEQLAGGRPPISESLVGPSYLDESTFESTILQGDYMPFSMKAYGIGFFGANNYPPQFPSLYHLHDDSMFPTNEREK